jgi:16S rRNA (guanine966-N2)-methyltransferase
VSRIISGDAGSIRLHSVAKATRPTGDRVKESVFSALEARGLIEDSAVLDLFAGTGALGLESLSRGATSVILVEKDPEAHEICQKNSVQVLKAVQKIRPGAAVSNKNLDAFRYLKSATQVFDLVFLDPPYEFANSDLLNILTSLRDLMSPGATVVIERSDRTEDLGQPDWLEVISNKKFGSTQVRMYQKI